MSHSSTPAAPSRPTGRAGRNLPAAIAIGVGLAALAIASLFVVKIAFVGLVLVVGLLGVWELSNALASNGTRVPIVPVGLGAVCILVSAYAGGVGAVAVATSLTVLLIFVARLAEGAEGFVRDVSAGVLVTAYVPVLGAFVLLMVGEADGPWRVVAFVLCTVCSDVGGYATGVFLGRHPMAPTISPKKSWEGFGGSLVFGMLGGVGIVTLGLGGDWWVGLVLGAACVAAATLGDLSESLIKRDLGLKDMSDLLPGHGGIMDRLDSLLAVAPVAWLVLHLLVPVA